jgi:hypothetical protein
LLSSEGEELSLKRDRVGWRHLIKTWKEVR